MVDSSPTKLDEDMRRNYEAACPHFKAVRGRCFRWLNGEPIILFVREEGGKYCARIQNVELKVWPLGYEINTWSEEIIEDPCDDKRECRDGKEIKVCDCSHIVRASVESGNDYESVYSAPWPTWDEHCARIRNRLRKYYERYNLAALVFADASWDFAEK
jgi:hypothetical protein